MPWLNAFFLLILALVLGWVPVLGPLALGFFAARANPGPLALLTVLPGLFVQTLGLLAARWLTNAADHYGLTGWLWSGVSWAFSPVDTLLGRPLSALVGHSPPGLFLLLFTAPVLLGLLVGAVTARR